MAFCGATYSHMTRFQETPSGSGMSKKGLQHNGSLSLSVLIGGIVALHLLVDIARGRFASQIVLPGTRSLKSPTPRVPGNDVLDPGP